MGSGYFDHFAWLSPDSDLDAADDDSDPMVLARRARLRGDLHAAWGYCEARWVSLVVMIVEVDGGADRRFLAEACRGGIRAAIRCASLRVGSFHDCSEVGRFVVVAPDCAMLLARAAAEGICAEVGRSGFVVSIGVSAANPRGGRWMSVFDGAERALLKARECGKGQVGVIDMRGDAPGWLMTA